MNADALAKQMQEGREAQEALEILRPVYARREVEILRQLIGWFRAEPWDERTALKFIASLAECRSLLDDLEQKARMAQQTTRRLYSTTR